MVRAIAKNEQSALQPPVVAPQTWSAETPTTDTYDRNYPHSQAHHSYRSSQDSRDSQQMRSGKAMYANGHSRNNSDNAPIPDTPLTEPMSTHSRKHDYDLHAMESRVSDLQSQEHRQNMAPAPIVTIRSEFPTLTRSRQQQSLACLVTVEIPENKFRPVTTDFSTPPLPSVVPPAPLKIRPAAKPAYLRNQEPSEVLQRMTEDLQQRVENWHGLEFPRFGALRLYSTIRVGKDRQSWQDLECFLFGEMLICIKEKKNGHQTLTHGGRSVGKATLKGSILIKRHLRDVQAFPEDLILTLSLTVAELPTFHLQFQNLEQLETWKQALLDLNHADHAFHPRPEYELEASGVEDEEWAGYGANRASSAASSYAPKTNTTGATDYSHHAYTDSRVPPSLHVPLDLVVVIPVSSSMQGLKISLLRDTLRFLVHHLGERDRMGLVTFGSGAGAVPLVGMTTKAWTGWSKVLASIKPVGQKSLRADAIEGANIAMDLLMGRQGANPISTILVISDSSSTDAESVDFVIQRAEAAKVGIYTFGLGLTHRPDSLIELSSRTKGAYTYVKDWMMLRECMSGCLGALQSTSHQGARIRIRLPEGSPAKFVKISGALHTTRRATGRDAEAVLGDLRYGDKRDILVQLVVDPDGSTQENFPQDHWETIVSGLEALGGATENDESRIESIEEVPILQADLIYGDLSKDGTTTQLSRPSLLTITMLPPSPRSKNSSRPNTPPIPPHPSIVQRRMELLTSDMLTRALTLVTRNQQERAHHLLNETRTILKGLGKGSLPPLPPQASTTSSKRTSPTTPIRPMASPRTASPGSEVQNGPRREKSPLHELAASPPRTPLPPPPPPPAAAARATPIDQVTMTALDSDLEAALEWINHPAVFSRDSRKAVLQAIGVISSQRAYTTRSASESLYADRIAGIRSAIEKSRNWRESEEQDALAEEQ